MFLRSMSGESKKYSWKNVRNLGFVSFFTDTSSEMIFGILPLFIIDDLGAGKAVLGLVEGMGEAAGYGTRTVSGTISDKVGKRKSLILLGYGLSTIAKPFFALSASWIHVFGIRVTDRIGKGVRTSPRDALLADSIEPVNIGKAFGLHRTMDQAGAIIGPLIAFGLLYYFEVRDIFWFSLIPGVIALFILARYVKERKIIPKNQSILSNFRVVLHGKFLLFLLIMTVFSIGAFNFSFILVESSELGLEKNFVPLVYVVINIAHTLIGIPSGILSDKIGTEKILLASFGLFFITSMIGYFETGFILVGFAMAAIFGLYQGMTITTQRTMVSRYVSENLRGTAFGIYYLFVGISFLVANLVFGLLWDAFDSQVAFGYSMITTITAIILLSVFVTKNKQIVSQK
ncbi:MFS transporter [Nitrosopumilus ureiphilus]|uniref:MFS transporter n=2 Tax=Nitrosopumilus ureiphilus TaxID=1470067 RepID=A0A7D5M5G8_9ARCH|nr:MFS transporter [Nitrosopumilus ureiphilus]